MCCSAAAEALHKLSGRILTKNSLNDTTSLCHMALRFDIETTKPSWHPPLADASNIKLLTMDIIETTNVL